MGKKQKEIVFKTNQENYVFVVKPATVKEVNGQIIPVTGKRVEFKKGILRTSDPETIERLRNDKFYNIDFYEDAKDFVKGRKEVDKEIEKKSTVVEENVEGFECEYCGKVCKTKGGLKAHIRKSKDDKHTFE